MKTITSAEVEHMIEDYLERHPGPTLASKIAEDLGLELGVTFELIHRLLEGGRIRRAKGKSCLSENLNDKAIREIEYDIQESSR